MRISSEQSFRAVPPQLRCGFTPRACVPYLVYLVRVRSSVGVLAISRRFRLCRCTGGRGASLRSSPDRHCRDTCSVYAFLRLHYLTF